MDMWKVLSISFAGARVHVYNAYIGREPCMLNFLIHKNNEFKAPKRTGMLIIKVC